MARRLPLAEEHGTLRGVRWHRTTEVPTCPDCRRVAAAQRAAQRKAAYLRRGDYLVDSCGVRRRLRALAAIGWGASALAVELGCDRSNVQRIREAPRSTRQTVALVVAVYDRLSMTPGPNPAAARVAHRRGWAPPLAWDDANLDDPRAHPSTGTKLARTAFDDIAVQRAMHGDRIHLRPTERAEVVRRLTAQGLTAKEIAERLDVAPRSVQRHRARHDAGRAA